MKKFFVNLVIVAIAAVSFTSCSMVNEPDEADYMNLSAYYTAEETGLVGTWTSTSAELSFEFTANEEDGYNTGVKMIPSHENPIQIYWQVVKFTQPSNTGIGQDVEYPYGYVRILGKNLVGGTWYFERISADMLRLVSPEGVEHICEMK